MYKNAGHLRKPTVFLFTEAEIKDEVSIVAFGHVQNLALRDESGDCVLA